MTISSLPGAGRGRGERPTDGRHKRQRRVHLSLLDRPPVPYSSSSPRPKQQQQQQQQRSTKDRRQKEGRRRVNRDIGGLCNDPISRRAALKCGARPSPQNHRGVPMTAAAPLNLSIAIRSSTPRLSAPLTSSSLRRCLHHHSAASYRATARSSISRTNGPRISAAFIRPRFFHSTPANFSETASKMGKPKALLLGEIDQ